MTPSVRADRRRCNRHRRGRHREAGRRQCTVRAATLEPLRLHRGTRSQRDGPGVDRRTGRRVAAGRRIPDRRPGRGTGQRHGDRIRMTPSVRADRRRRNRHRRGRHREAGRRQCTVRAATLERLRLHRGTRSQRDGPGVDRRTGCRVAAGRRIPDRRPGRGTGQRHGDRIRMTPSVRADRRRRNRHRRGRHREAGRRQCTVRAATLERLRLHPGTRSQRDGPGVDRRAAGRVAAGRRIPDRRPGRGTGQRHGDRIRMTPSVRTDRRRCNGGRDSVYRHIRHPRVVAKAVCHVRQGYRAGVTSGRQLAGLDLVDRHA